MSDRIGMNSLTYKRKLVNDCLQNATEKRKLLLKSYNAFGKHELATTKNLKTSSDNLRKMSTHEHCPKLVQTLVNVAGCLDECRHHRREFAYERHLNTVACFKEYDEKRTQLKHDQKQLDYFLACCQKSSVAYDKANNAKVPNSQTIAEKNRLMDEDLNRFFDHENVLNHNAQALNEWELDDTCKKLKVFS